MNTLLVLLALQQAPPVELPRVLVLAIDAAPANRTFSDVLRIQLASTADVQTDAERLSGTLPAKIDGALARGAKASALVTVWIEEISAGPYGRDFVLYAVGQRIPRALVEIARLPASEGAAAHRTLALKLAALLESLLASSRTAPDLTRPVVETMRPVVETTRPVVETTRPVVETIRKPEEAIQRTATALLVEVGAFGASESGNVEAQAGLTLVAGARIARQNWMFEGYATGRFSTDLVVSDAAGQLVVREWSLGGGARILRGDQWLVGGGLEVDASFLDAAGTTSEGRMGAVTRTVPTVLAALEGRLKLTAHSQVRFAVGPEVALVRQSFVAAGAPLADLGRMRAFGELSLVFSVR